MSAKLQKCIECGAKFYGRSDAMYCTARCKQRAYERRKRAAGRAAK